MCEYTIQIGGNQASQLCGTEGPGVGYEVSLLVGYPFQYRQYHDLQWQVGYDTIRYDSVYLACS